MPLPKQTDPPSMRISLTRTQGEWDALDKILGNKGLDFHSYIRRTSSKLANTARECPVCLTPAAGKKITKRHHIPTEIYKALETIAKAMGKDVGIVIDEMLLSPLLSKGKDVAL